MSDPLHLLATCPLAVEPLLAEELRGLGAEEVRETRGGVSFAGTLEIAYRACLWSRTASRVLLPLATVAAGDAAALYQGVQALAWEAHLDPDATLAVDFTGRSEAITHTHFGALKVKDAVVDRLREVHGRRPGVDVRAPDLRIHCHLNREEATVSLDLSGESLHRRGYRQEGLAAPLKENLAAALLLKAGWPGVAATGGALVDPMCGSGTLPLEAALLAADIAPGLLRQRWGFQGWRGHDRDLWTRLLAEARERREAGPATVPPIAGYDQSARAVRAALLHAGAAGVGDLIHFECRELERAVPPAGAATGLVMVNPPYGERLGDPETLPALYARLGDVLKARFGGWKAAVLTGDEALGKRMGLRAHRVNTFYNGALRCRLLHFEVEPERFVDREAADARRQAAALEQALAGGAEAFANRLRKNLRSLGRWARREGIGCYRLYDADVPEYAVAVDRYEDHIHVQEYEPPATVDPERARERLEQVKTVLPAILDVPQERIHFKLRRRQRGTAQYTRQGSEGRFLPVREGPCQLLVNLDDYLDTGLFLDHRLTRAMLGRLARGRHFLNLFAYTATATVHAALGGAASTTSVDLSPTYLEWARRNLELNGITGPRHRLVRADCVDWLAKARERYGLIFLDPPTFSNSSRTDTTLDIQRDHVALIRAAAARLEPDGILIFSCNYRRFRLEREALAGLVLEDIGAETLPRDFRRRPRIHSCWRIRSAGSA